MLLYSLPVLLKREQFRFIYSNLNVRFFLFPFVFTVSGVTYLEREWVRYIWHGNSKRPLPTKPGYLYPSRLLRLFFTNVCKCLLLLVWFKSRKYQNVKHMSLFCKYIIGFLLTKKYVLMLVHWEYSKANDHVTLINHSIMSTYI